MYVYENNRVNLNQFNRFEIDLKYVYNEWLLFKIYFICLYLILNSKVQIKQQ